jgi:hypothetical protein
MVRKSVHERQAEQNRLSFFLFYMQKKSILAWNLIVIMQEQ